MTYEKADIEMPKQLSLRSKHDLDFINKEFKAITDAFEQDKVEIVQESLLVLEPIFKRFCRTITSDFYASKFFISQM
jgi:hypothetical protein